MAVTLLAAFEASLDSELAIELSEAVGLLEVPDSEVAAAWAALVADAKEEKRDDSTNPTLLVMEALTAEPSLSREEAKTPPTLVTEAKTEETTLPGTPSTEEIRATALLLTAPNREEKNCAEERGKKKTRGAARESLEKCMVAAFVWGFKSGRCFFFFFVYVDLGV